MILLTTVVVVLHKIVLPVLVGIPFVKFVPIYISNAVLMSIMIRLGVVVL